MNWMRMARAGKLKESPSTNCDIMFILFILITQAVIYHQVYCHNGSVDISSLSNSSRTHMRSATKVRAPLIDDKLHPAKRPINYDKDNQEMVNRRNNTNGTERKLSKRDRRKQSIGARSIERQGSLHEGMDEHDIINEADFMNHTDYEDHDPSLFDLDLSAESSSDTTPPSSLISANTEQDVRAIEELVRNQVNWAGSSWATQSPLHYVQHLLSNDSSLSPESTNYLRNAIAAESQQYPTLEQHQIPHMVTQEESNNLKNKLYPNHNYKHNFNPEGPDWQFHMKHPLTIDRSQDAPLKTTLDPLTASSDESNKYGSIPLVSTISMDSSNVSTTPSPNDELLTISPERLQDLHNFLRSRELASHLNRSEPSPAPTLPKAQPTISPSILRALETLDRLRVSTSTSEKLDSPPMIKLAFKSHSIKQGQADESKKHPTPKQSNSKFQIDHAPSPDINRESGKTTELSNNDKLQAFIDSQRLSTIRQTPSIYDDASNASFDEPEKGLHIPEVIKIGDLELLTNSRPPIVKPSLNFNNSLDANSRWIRYRNFILKNASQNGASSKFIRLPSGDHLVLRQHSKKFIPDLYSSTTVSADKMAGIKPPIRFPSTKATTVQVPISTLATAKPSSLYTSAQNTVKANSSYRSVASHRPAHHHHHHSHVHSIKPSVISIPLPAQAKFNTFDPILAVAAAAAAAATASASANRNRLSQPHLTPQVITHPMITHVRPSIPLKKINTIPIGGTLASTRANQQNFDKNSRGSGVITTYQTSILTNLLDSANRALKLVAGNTANLLNLQAPHNNSPVLNIPESLAGKDYSRLFTHQRGGSAELFGPQFATVSQDHHNDQDNSMESVGLYQAPNEENQSMEAILAALMASNEPHKSIKSMENSFSSHDDESKTAPFPLSSSSQDWNSNLLTSNDSDEVVYAPLGENSNFLLPLLPRSRIQNSRNFNKQQVSSSNTIDDQFEAMNSDGPQWDQKIGAPHASSMSEASVKRPIVASQPQKGGSRLASNKTKVIKVKKPLTDKMKKQLHEQSTDNIQYALAHYINHEPHSHSLKWNNNQNDNLMYDLYDERSNKYSMPQSSVELLSTDSDTDSFRPAKQSQNHFTLKPPLSSKQLQNILKSSIDTEQLILSNPQLQNLLNGHNMDHSKKYHTTRSIRGQSPSSTEDYKTHLMSASGSGLSQDSYKDFKLDPHLLQLLPQHSHHDMAHHTLTPGSSLKAASELLNYGKQQLIEHYLQHHLPAMSGLSRYPKDMATSESARLAVTTTTKGTYLLFHFWPLILAMLPIMIIVAILVQLVMSAPLVLFAMTTLTVSRFVGAVLGPYWGRDGMDRNGNELKGTAPSGNHFSSLLKSTIKTNSTRVSNQTQAKGARRRRRRSTDFDPETEDFLETEPLDDYFELLKLKLDNIAGR